MTVLLVSDTIREKAERLLADNRVQVIQVGPETLARVRGDHDRYVVSWSRSSGWKCECPYPRWRCSHVVAVMLVLVDLDLEEPA